LEGHIVYTKNINSIISRVIHSATSALYEDLIENPLISRGQ
jgi:hypothetical protein